MRGGEPRVRVPLAEANRAWTFADGTAALAHQFQHHDPQGSETINTSRGIGIAPEDQEAIVAGLSRVLADSYTLYLKTHNYHWNVVGPMFHSLHAMFMEE